MYVGFSLNGQTNNVQFFSGWYGAFKAESDNVVIENNVDLIQVSWDAGKNECIMLYNLDPQKRPENTISQVWRRSELPEALKISFSALK